MPKIEDHIRDHIRADLNRMDYIYSRYLKKHGLGRSNHRSALDWVVECVRDYDTKKGFYETACRKFRKDILKSNPEPKIYSHSHRVKDLLNLADKLRRKCLNKDRKKRKVILLDKLFTKEGVTDLGGVRILHLYKGDWQQIDKYLEKHCGSGKSFEIIEREAYVRSHEDIKPYKDKHFDVASTESRYTSLHYLLQCNDQLTVGPPTVGLGPKTVIFEVQVRTVFENGRSEIEHQRRYPAGASAVDSKNLDVLSEVSGAADHVAETFESLDELPNFVPMETTSELLRAAEKVKVYSPELGWAAGNSSDLAKNIKNSYNVKYEYYVPLYDDKGKNDIIEDRKNCICTELKNEGVLDQVKWYRLKNTIVPPVFNDLILLKNTYYDNHNREHLGIQGVTNESVEKSTTRLDALVHDKMGEGLNILKNFFEQCESENYRKKWEKTRDLLGLVFFGLVFLALKPPQPRQVSGSSQ